jgi:hypothetical protein
VNTTLERELIDALDAAGRRSSGPDSAFFVAVARAVTRRRRWRRAGFAALVAVLSLVVGGSVPQLVGRRPDPVLPPPPPPDLSATFPTTVPDFDKAPKAADIWRDAVRTLPGRLPNGSRYVVQAVLPGDKYLVLEHKNWPPGYRLQGPGVLDAATGTVREVAPADESATVIAAGVSGGDAVWVIARLADRMAGYEVWAAPLAGGAPRKLATVTDDRSGYTRTFALAGRYVLWDRHQNYRDPNGRSGVRTPGIYRLPVTGGQPELMVSTEGYRLQDYYAGWGGAPAVAIRNGNRAAGDRGWIVDDPAAAPLIDLATGVRVPWRQAPEVDTGPMGYLACGLSGCTGRHDAPADRSRPTTTFVQRRDGSGYLEVGDMSIGPVGDGRFLSLEYEPVVPPGAPRAGRRIVVWDRQLARAAVCGIFTNDGSGDGAVRADQLERGRPFVVWTEGSKTMLLDVTRIRP